MDEISTARSTQNRFLEPARVPALSQEVIQEVRRFHRTLAGYKPTPLHDLPELAAGLGLGRILVKDESQRLGLKAFKVLGAAYGLARFLETHPPGTAPITFATATDGNHGRAVAWATRQLGHRAVVFVPDDMVSARRQAIAAEGAEVRAVSGHYDQAVAEAEKVSRKNGWAVLSDNAYPGYERISTWITTGYCTLFEEIREELEQSRISLPSHVFLQGGVGGLASTALRVMKSWSSQPHFICVEPVEADCLLSSIRSRDGSPQRASGSIHSIMAGLNCSFPSLEAWPILRVGIDLFLAVEDQYAEDAVRRLYRPRGSDARIVAGETGAAGLAGLLALLSNPALGADLKYLEINDHSEVLVINTEGDTDPAGFRRIVEGDPGAI